MSTEDDPAPPAPAACAHASEGMAPWKRTLWMTAGGVSLVLGIIGIFLPVMPTVPFALLAAWCFSRGSRRLEQWMLDHPHFGQPIRDWRANRAVPLRAKQFATVMMTISSVGSWWFLPSPWRWVPGVCCAAVAAWMWTLPDVAPKGVGTTRVP